MTYAVKEMFYSLQGEGRHTGRPAVFCRFAGCNLWSGREQDRATADCRFCGTDFVGLDGEGGGRFKTASALTDAIEAMWAGQGGKRYAVLTGDELKLVFPQDGLDPSAFERLTFHHYLLQPMDGPDLEANTQTGIAYCLQHPQWRLSLQTHKFMGIR